MNWGAVCMYVQLTCYISFRCTMEQLDKSTHWGGFNWKTPCQPSPWFYQLLKTFPESGMSSGVANKVVTFKTSIHFHIDGIVFYLPAKNTALLYF